MKNSIGEAHNLVNPPCINHLNGLNALNDFEQKQALKLIDQTWLKLT